MEDVKEMKTEIGGTFKWSDKAKAYAAAFREGDAVKLGGEWHEVKKYGNTHSTSTTSTVTAEVNPYNLNYAPDGESRYKGIAKGFLESRVESPYEIVTPKEYEVQEGDKLVRLGNTVEYYGCSEFTFGETYEVFRSEDGYLFYKNDMTTALLASYLKEEGNAWGIIPRYENVKKEEVFEIDYSGKFKEGDYVKVIATAFEDSGSDIGKFGIVTSISERYKHFAPYLVEFDLGGNEHFNEAELALIERVEKKEEEGMNEKTELVEPIKCTGKFEVGDRVKVKAAAFKASEPDVGRTGIISQVNAFETNAAYRVVFDEGDFDFFNEAELELVQWKEVSPEQEAFEFLLTGGESIVKNFFISELNDWAKAYLKAKEYDSAKQAIEILKKLEESE